jgi:ankyrin repeat protein
MLLDAGADLEATTSWGATPFDWGATMGSARVADLLLARGAKGMNVVAAANLGKLDLGSQLSRFWRPVDFSTTGSGLPAK